MFVSLSWQSLILSHCKHDHILAMVSNIPTDKHQSQEEKEQVRDGKREIEVGLGFILCGLCLRAV